METKMLDDGLFNQFHMKFEKIIVVALILALMVATLYATVIFIVLLLKTIITVEPIWTVLAGPEGSNSIGESISKLQEGLYHIFGGFLLILLGVELINTVRSFSKDNFIKMESIVGIAIIATARHLITLDYHHAVGLVIFAMGFVVLALIVGYFLLKTRADKSPNIE